MGNANSIVLNGKLYDATSGKLIHDQTKLAPKKPAPKVKKRGGSIDGVVTKSHGKHHAKHHKPANHKVSHHSRQPVASHGHKPQKASTLMRSSVSKPTHASSPNHSVKHRDAKTSQRLERAKAVSKSHHIQHFGKNHSTSQHTAYRSVAKKHASVPVAKAPEHHSAHKQEASTSRSSKSDQLVAKALVNARAHEAVHAYKQPKRRLHHKLGLSRRTTNFAVGTLAVLLLAGFFVYQNVPNLSMRLAASRAGFAAHQPGYTPSGFSQENLVSYSPGRITISFKSNSDQRAYQLTQQVSNWNSQSLASNYLSANGKSFQAYQANGKTVYIYDQSNATWVNGGVWYQIEGDSSLDTSQLLRIANGI